MAEYKNLHFILSTGASTSTQVPKKNEIVILSDSNRINQFVIGDGKTSIATLANNPFIAKDEILNQINVMEFKGVYNELPEDTDYSNGDVILIILENSVGSYKRILYIYQDDKGWQEIGDLTDLPIDDKITETGENTVSSKAVYQHVNKEITNLSEDTQAKLNEKIDKSVIKNSFNENDINDTNLASIKAIDTRFKGVGDVITKNKKELQDQIAIINTNISGLHSVNETQNTRLGTLEGDLERTIKPNITSLQETSAAQGSKIDSLQEDISRLEDEIENAVSKANTIGLILEYTDSSKERYDLVYSTHATLKEEE